MFKKNDPCIQIQGLIQTVWPPFPLWTKSGQQLDCLLIPFILTYTEIRLTFLIFLQVSCTVKFTISSNFLSNFCTSMVTYHVWQALTSLGNVLFGGSWVVPHPLRVALEHEYRFKSGHSGSPPPTLVYPCSCSWLHAWVDVHTNRTREQSTFYEKSWGLFPSTGENLKLLPNGVTTPKGNET